MSTPNSPLDIHTLVVGPFAVNCYVVAATGDSTCVVIDPGGDATRILEKVKTLGWEPNAILLTHGHLDHLLAVQALQSAWDVPVLAHRAEEPFFQNLHSQAAFLGLPPPPPVAVTRYLEEGEPIPFGSAHLSVLWTPGHTPGSCSFVGSSEVFVGDTLFAGSVGRTDLPGGNASQLLHSIREKLFALPGSFVVYPGHGPATSIAHEKATNPFV